MEHLNLGELVAADREGIRAAVALLDSNQREIASQLAQLPAQMAQSAIPATGDPAAIREFVALLRQHEGVVIETVAAKAHNELIEEMNRACEWAGASNASKIVAEAVQAYRTAGSPALQDPDAPELPEQPGDDENPPGSPRFAVQNTEA